MPPAETQTVTEVVAPTSNANEESKKEWKPQAPLQLSGALDSYKSFDVTPIIGKEFVDVNLKDWLKAPNSDELIRDLAITSKTIAYFH
jgi:hypothetical protein